MSGTLAPTHQQYPTGNVEGINEKQKPLKFSKTAKIEYVAGGSYGSSDLTRTLAHRSDALTKRFGDAIIYKMLRDPEVSKCITVIKVGVLGDGVTFFPSVPKPAPFVERAGDPSNAKRKAEYEEQLERYNLASKYAEFVTRAIENLDDIPFRSILENMLDAITFGNKVAEQTYKELEPQIVERDWKELLPSQDNPISGSRTLWTLKSIRVKPRQAVRFEVDKYSKLIGFRSRYAQHKAEDKILPREKFLVLTFKGKDGDPRGNSILEPIYNAWHLKMQLWPEYLRWLLQCAIPGLVGYTSPETDNKKYLRNEDGSLARDADDNPIYEAEVDTLLNALIEVRNSTAIALPAGAKVEPIQNGVSGDPFKGMRDVLNEEIEMGLILQTLATSEGTHMSRAAAQSHMSILDLFIWFIKGLVMDMITNDLLKPLFKANFGDDFDMTMLPKVSMGDTERRDWATDMLAIATGVKSGFIGKSQYVGYDKIIGAPDRDVEADDEDARITAEREQQLKQSAVSVGNDQTIRKQQKPNRQVMDRMKELVAQYEELFDEE